jgi:hypothetical protein
MRQPDDPGCSLGVQLGRCRHRRLCPRLDAWSVVVLATPLESGRGRWFVDALGPAIRVSGNQRLSIDQAKAIPIEDFRQQTLVGRIAEAPAVSRHDGVRGSIKER